MIEEFFARLRRTNDKSDCIKTFDTFEPKVMVFGNNFGIKIVLINNVYFESFILEQTCDFLKRGYLCSDAPVHEVGVFLK